MLIEPCSGLYWTRLSHSNFTEHNFSLMVIICISSVKIQSPVHDLYPKQFFCEIADMTLTFDLVTLTLGQLFCLININHMSKYHQNPIIRSWFIGEKSSMLTYTHTYTHTYIHTYGHECLYSRAPVLLDATKKWRKCRNKMSKLKKNQMTEYIDIALSDLVF